MNDALRVRLGRRVGKEAEPRAAIIDSQSRPPRRLANAGMMRARKRTKEKFTRLQLIWADGGYAGQLVAWVKEHCGWVLDIVKRQSDLKGFHVLPHRWIVERTFGWLGRYRRLSKDYEGRCDTSEAMVYAVMVNVMVRRLARQQAGQPVARAATS
jgi:transposase